MRTSYKECDVELLLKDITGLVEPLPTRERELKIQSGAHYSEMLPLEYRPGKEYMQLYHSCLEEYALVTAQSIASLAQKIIRAKGRGVVLVSLARAGIPVGILLKHYIADKYGFEPPHYAVSIIRGKGIDCNAMDYILKKHPPKSIQFVDGWTGKGAICAELKREAQKYPLVDFGLAAAADPAYVTTLCGTHEDIIIPSACLNSTVSGLISRTFLRKDIIGENDFHGAAYYGELLNEDLSYEFISAIESKMDYQDILFEPESKHITGIEEIQDIADKLNISDINLIKPGIGETTRVLLRRVPWKILISGRRDEACLQPIMQLAKEKNVPVESWNFKCYKSCGIIKNMSADL